MAEPTPAADPAEIEAGARALNEEWAPLATRRAIAATVLVAVLPDHAARVRDDERAKVAEAIAQAIERSHCLEADHPKTERAMNHAYRRAAAIARQHTTGEATP